TGVDQLTALVEVESLVERPADALRHAAMDLTLHDGGIDHDAAVVHHHVAHKAYAPCHHRDAHNGRVLAAGPRCALGRTDAPGFQSRLLARRQNRARARLDELQRRLAGGLAVRI